MWRTWVPSPVVAARTLLPGMGLRMLELHDGLMRTGGVGTPEHGAGTKDGMDCRPRELLVHLMRDSQLVAMVVTRLGGQAPLSQTPGANLGGTPGLIVMGVVRKMRP